MYLQYSCPVLKRHYHHNRTEKAHEINLFLVDTNNLTYCICVMTDHCVIQNNRNDDIQENPTVTKVQSITIYIQARRLDNASVGYTLGGAQPV